MIDPSVIEAASEFQDEAESVVTADKSLKHETGTDGVSRAQSGGGGEKNQSDSKIRKIQGINTRRCSAQVALLAAE